MTNGSGNQSERIIQTVGKFTSLSVITEDQSTPSKGFVYTPQRAFFVARDTNSRGWYYVNGENKLEIVSFSDVFEATFFDEDCQIIWIHEHAGEGRKRSIKSVSKATESENSEELEYRDSESLIWGSPAKTRLTPPAGWSIMADSRIGTLAVPFGTEGEEHIVMIQRNYLKKDDYGNYYPYASRFIRFQSAGNKIEIDPIEKDVL